MARVTVEDCTNKLPNRFELVAYAAQRTRQLAAGSPLGVERDNDKNPVVSLREIAANYVSPEDLREAVIAGFRRHVEVEPQEEEYADLFIKDATPESIDQTDDTSSMAIEDLNKPEVTMDHSDEYSKDNLNDEDSFKKEPVLTGDKDDLDDVNCTDKS